MHMPNVAQNGLNPTWRDTDAWLAHVYFPEMALLRFCVHDGDLSDDPFIGQAVFPVEHCRTGYRSVPLCNKFSEPLPLASLLVHIAVTERECISKFV